ncbi:MAG TPA: hypothetical protein VG755_19050 [Nannocystaceae bacterium]|nr:hypothetical protein [Nannocystaceae bacterium]
MLASAAPFDNADVIAILAFMIDVFVGPVSLVILAIAAIARIGWRRWLTALAIVNLAIAAVLVLLEDGGLGSFIALAWLQGLVAIAVLVVGRTPPWRDVVFGKR